MLNEINTSLPGDYTRCQVAFSELNDLNAHDTLIKFINAEFKDIESIEYYFYRTTLDIQIEHHSSACELLKSGGLDIFSNDLLRIAFSNLFGYEYPHLQNNISKYNNQLRIEWSPFPIDYGHQNSIELDPIKFSRYTLVRI
jgi:hypothetical protein